MSWASRVTNVMCEGSHNDMSVSFRCKDVEDAMKKVMIKGNVVNYFYQNNRICREPHFTTFKIVSITIVERKYIIHLISTIFWIRNVHLNRNFLKIRPLTSVKSRPLEEVLLLPKHQPRQLKKHCGKIEPPTQHDIFAQSDESFRTVLHDVKQAHSR